MEDVLIIKNPSTILDFSIIEKKGYNLEFPYKKLELKILRYIRKFHFALNIPYKDIWFNKNIINHDFSTIIIFESLIIPEYLYWLRKKYPDARIIIWYWNIVENTMSPTKINDDTIEKWSFSRKDCYNYGMKFNPAPFFKETEFPISTLEVDFTFVGKDKGRLNDLLELQEKLLNMGFKTNFIITPTHKFKRNKNYSKKVSYQDTLLLNSKSKAIIDIIEVSDSGQSLRVFESLFSGKKLVTNSLLIKDYEFFNENNIFVIENNSLDGIEEFMKKDYVQIDEQIKERYDFESWLNRFFKEDTIINSMQEYYNETLRKKNG